MNDIKTVNYSDMAEEYFKSAQNLQQQIEKLKLDKKLQAKNPQEYNANILQLYDMYLDCMSAGNILKERANKYT